MCWMTNGQVEIFVKKKSLLNLKPTEFFLRGIKNQPDKYQEMIQNKS